MITVNFQEFTKQATKEQNQTYLQDESFSAEESRGEVFTEFHGDVDRVGSTQQGTLLTNNLSTILGDVEPYNFGREIRAECHLSRPRFSLIGIITGGEQQ